MIERFQLEIKREKALAERDALMAERGIDIDEPTWEVIVTNEDEGPEQLAEWYHWYMSRIARNDFESKDAFHLKTILKLRAEKWQGVNEKLKEKVMSRIKVWTSDGEGPKEVGGLDKIHLMKKAIYLMTEPFDL